jgi:hypothetical protein
MVARERNRRSGFTLFQLLAILALLAFLLGLFLPSLAQIRQAAMRMEAMNNLKQVMLGLHNHHDAFKFFPAAVGRMPGRQTDNTLWFNLLPFLEHDILYRDAEGDVWKNGTAAAVVKIYLNPADPSGPPDHQYKGMLATSSFAANWMLFGPKPCRITTITDGTSNTIALGERYQMCDGQPNAWAYPALYYWAPTFMVYSEARFQVAPDPASKECDVRLAQTPFRSGMLVALADGSTRPLSPNLSWLTYRAACTPRGGEVLGEDC